MSRRIPFWVGIVLKRPSVYTGNPYADLDLDPEHFPEGQRSRRVLSIPFRLSLMWPRLREHDALARRVNLKDLGGHLLGYRPGVLPEQPLLQHLEVED